MKIETLLLSGCLLWCIACSDDDFPVPTVPLEPTPGLLQQDTIAQSVDTTTSVPRVTHLTFQLEDRIWKAARKFSTWDYESAHNAWFDEDRQRLKIRGTYNKNNHDEWVEFHLDSVTLELPLPATFEMQGSDEGVLETHPYLEAISGTYILKSWKENSVTITHLTDEFVAGTFRASLRHLEREDGHLEITEGSFQIPWTD